MNIVRVKVTSDCIGIKRFVVAYIPYTCGTYDLSLYDHPLKEFKELEINDKSIRIGNIKLDLNLNLESSQMLTKELKSLDKTVIEYKRISILPFKLDINLIEEYKKNIEDNIFFDNLNGEFEFIIGLIYKYEVKDLTKAEAYFDASLKKGFKTIIWN